MGRGCFGTKIAAFAVVILASGLAPARADSLEVADDSYGYYLDKTTYDNEKDVVVTLGQDADFGPFWVAVQCSSDAVWFMNKLTSQWKAQQTLPDDMKTFHDVVCGLRNSLPYMAF